MINISSKDGKEQIKIKGGELETFWEMSEISEKIAQKYPRVANYMILGLARVFSKKRLHKLVEDAFESFEAAEKSKNLGDDKIIEELLLKLMQTLGGK